MRPTILAFAITTLLLAGCSGDSPLAPRPTAQRDASAASQSSAATPVFSAAQGAAIDLGGTWNWSETVTTIFPPLIAGIIGIEPEGLVTHATCYDNGTLTLVQTDNTFVGTATQTSTCTTNGGQRYTPPFPPTLDILDGRIDGRSIDFSFSEGCPYQGTVSLDGGIAVQIVGTGKCQVALHPALLKTVTWQATR
jgi:hypothetical protein